MLGGFKSKYVIPQLIKEKLAFSRKNWSGKNGRSVRESRAIPKSWVRDSHECVIEQSNLNHVLQERIRRISSWIVGYFFPFQWVRREVAQCWTAAQQAERVRRLPKCRRISHCGEIHLQREARHPGRLQRRAAGGCLRQSTTRSLRRRHLSSRVSSSLLDTIVSFGWVTWVGPSCWCSRFCIIVLFFFLDCLSR